MLLDFGELSFLMGILFCSGCATPHEKTWDAMHQCAIDNQGDPISTICQERFKAIVIPGRIEEVRINTASTELSLSIGDAFFAARTIRCVLENPDDRENVSHLKLGKVVTVQGTMARAGKTNAFTDIVLNPCNLVQK